MFEIRQTAVFADWFGGLRDRVARAQILRRIERMQAGQLGDVKPVGGGVSELRVHHGPGYRVYFVRRGERIILLLCGGDKDSQTRDIAQAKKLAEAVE
jgi:putative addiction module killer protein